MFFKNLLIYRANKHLNFDNLNKLLSELAFTPIKGMERSRFGWVPPFSNFSDFCYNGENFIVIRAKKQEKKVAKDQLNDLMSVRIKEIEEREQRPLKKKEKDDIKDAVVEVLLPTAGYSYSYTTVIINTKTLELYVDASSSKKAEDVIALLRKSIGSLPVIPAFPEDPVETKVTDWVRTEDYPQGFLPLGESEIKSILSDGGTIRCKDTDLTTMTGHIEENMFVTKIRMSWQDRISFTLCDDYAIKSLKFSDELKDQNDDIPREDVFARQRADMEILVGELNAMTEQLMTALGGYSTLE